MIDFLQNTIDGMMIGSSYGLLALGFTLIFGVMRRLNLSYGPSIMIGAYLGTLLHVQDGAGPLAVAAAAVLGAVLAGIYVERLCFAPMGAGAGIASMVSSFAIWMQLEQAAVLVLPRHTYPFPAARDRRAARARAVPAARRSSRSCWPARSALAAGVHLVALPLALRPRRCARSSAIRPAAHLVGINVKPARARAPSPLPRRSAAWPVILVLAIDQQVTPMFGMWATLKGLIAMMIGGLGSMPGAVLGGLLLGVVEAHSQWYFGPQVRDLVAYLVLFAFLVLRPGGLLGAAPARDTAAPQRRA